MPYLDVTGIVGYRRWKGRDPMDEAKTGTQKNTCLSSVRELSEERVKCSTVQPTANE